MDKLLYLLPALACPLGMGAMMWLMMRTSKARPPAGDGVGERAEEPASVRADVHAVRAQPSSGMPSRLVPGTDGSGPVRAASNASP